MKKFIIGFVSSMIIISPAAYAGSDTTLYLNGTPVDCIVSGNNLGNISLSARNIFEAAGFTVQWFEDEHRVTAFNSDINITMYSDENRIYVNNKSFLIDGGITVQDDIFVIPISVVSDALNADLNISGNNIYIKSSVCSDSKGWEYDVLSLVNNERKKYGLAPLIWNSNLANAAYLHCSDMAARDYFSHDTPEGLSAFDRMKSLNINYTVAAENIAAGQPDPQSVMNAWMNSTEHRENILNPKLKEIGIAFVRGGSYGIYWAQEFATFK